MQEWRSRSERVSVLHCVLFLDFVSTVLSYCQWFFVVKCATCVRPPTVITVIN